MTSPPPGRSISLNQGKLVQAPPLNLYVLNVFEEKYISWIEIEHSVIAGCHGWCWYTPQLMCICNKLPRSSLMHSCCDVYHHQPWQPEKHNVVNSYIIFQSSGVYFVHGVIYTYNTETIMNVEYKCIWTSFTFVFQTPHKSRAGRKSCHHATVSLTKACGRR